MTYTAEPIETDGILSDIRIRIDSKTWHMWGRNGVAREKGLADSVPENTLPVLIGSGVGHCLTRLAEKGMPVAVVDKEHTIREVSGANSKHLGENILWLDDDNPNVVMDRLLTWQSKNDSKPFSPLVIPLYQRLDRTYYGALSQALKDNAKADFWSHARYPKFQSAKPRILFFDSNYFLCGEILSALQRLEIEHQAIRLDTSGTGSTTFIESLLKTVIDFKPDFVLTVNHFGLDREGKLAGLLNDLSLPLASWFVDNPHLILYDYDHPGTKNTAIFTFDAGNLDEMHAKGFDNVHYLPLATDPHRFKPGLCDGTPPEWTCDISFVGNSMTAAVAKSLADSGLPSAFAKKYEALAREFEASDHTSVHQFLKSSHQDWLELLNSLPTRENRLAFESLLTWEATRQYRLSCVKSILDFSPVIVGDEGWKSHIDAPHSWNHISQLDYYEDLPCFYPLSSINFNCTSRQMIGAVNQRVFDVPACGGFVLTDYRQQMENLFDLDKEVAIYNNKEEIPELVKKFLADSKIRNGIAEAARKRIIAEHTYEIRISSLIDTLRKTFS